MYDIDTKNRTKDLRSQEELKMLYPSLSACVWGNSDSSLYYQNIPIDILKEFAVLGGFDTGCDVDLIYPLINKAENVLDVMSGYGRVINRLLKKGFSGNIFAIERNSKFYNYLLAQYKHIPSVIPIHIDIMKYNPKTQFNIILLMWSAISEFPQEQQQILINRLSHWLNPQGLIILDTLPVNIVPHNIYKQGQHFVAFSEYGTIHGYIPRKEEIVAYAKYANLTLRRQLNYTTRTGLSRNIYILQNF